MHDIGLSVSHTSVFNKRKDLIKKQEVNIEKVIRHKEKVVSEFSKNQQKPTELSSESHGTDTPREVNSTDNLSSENAPVLHSDISNTGVDTPFEVLGDNIDITVAPAKMCVDRQRQSLHWFLTMVKQRQVMFQDSVKPLDTDSEAQVMDLPTSHWIPDRSQMSDLKKDMKFHVAHVLLKYIEPLNDLKASYPQHITHPYMELTKNKTTILNCDLIEASENSSQGMIEILQNVHTLVPHIDGKVVEKIVFGGDVLTNERAFTAQSAMQNNLTDTSKLTGILHRPEGLHRQFNFLLVI